MAISWKKHFNKSNSNLDHPYPTRFVSGPWHSGLGPPVHPLFLLYRILLSSAFTGLLVWSVAMNWDEGKWLLFLTNWGFLACSLQSYFGTGIVLRKFLDQNSSSRDSSTNDLRTDGEHMSVAYKMYWIFYNVAITNAFFITILYWTLLYPPATTDLELRGGFGLNFSVHGMNSILMLIDFVIGGPPSRLLHVHHPIVFALTYIIFNAIYWAAGGKGRGDADFIYPILDWDNKPGLGVGITFGGAFLLVIIHFVVCCMAGGRSILSEKRKSHAIQNLSTIQPPDLEKGNINKGYM